MNSLQTRHSASSSHCVNPRAFSSRVHNSQPVCGRSGRVAQTVYVRGSVEDAQVSTPLKKRVKLSVLPAVSRAVEIQGLTAKFESLAGRAAMLGTTTALCIEAFTEEGLFQGGGDEFLLTAIAVALTLSASLAFLQSSDPLDVPLLEPVMASLTSTKRSGAAIKDAQLDSVVDDVIKASFSASVLSALVVDAIVDDSKYI